jgi:teichuronic acid biosynthesis glycosyltransferase TuaC
MHRILFVCSGNKSIGPGPVVANQAQSLMDAGVDVSFFLVKGKGSIGYLSNIFRLWKTIKYGKYDIIHAHGISALLATFTLKRPLVVSLLGSELNESKVIKYFNGFLAKHYWSHTIVKSYDMALKLNCTNHNNLSIIPNGVNLQNCRPINQIDAKKAINYKNPEKKIILWMADPGRKSKNFTLAIQAILDLNLESVELLQKHNIPKEKVPFYLNAADIILLTSLWEGSPNIIKEAMACNRPVVSTDVGDVKWLFGDEPGHFITSFIAEDVALKIGKALHFTEKNIKTKGRQRIIELGLNADTVAERLVKIYKTVNKVAE